ncbi:MAG: hypothetical protein IPP19_08760 [Verrucomicrobia bacterium]|nr:hypothetical protein [Verrucomicrobiota bacterium]
MFWGADQEEFCAYVTDLLPEEATPAQIVLTYRKRGDPENVFDELKNQWGFSGFCSGNGVVTETAARLLLTYNLWSLFVRVLKEEGHHHEAVTSRDELLMIPAKLVKSGRQKTLKLSVGDKWWEAISLCYAKLERLVCPQLRRSWTCNNDSNATCAGISQTIPTLAPKTNPLILNCGFRLNDRALCGMFIARWAPYFLRRESGHQKTKITL